MNSITSEIQQCSSDTRVNNASGKTDALQYKLQHIQYNIIIRKCWSNCLMVQVLQNIPTRFTFTHIVMALREFVMTFDIVHCVKIYWGNVVSVSFLEAAVCQMSLIVNQQHLSSIQCPAGKCSGFHQITTLVKWFSEPYDSTVYYI